MPSFYRKLTAVRLMILGVLAIALTSSAHSAWGQTERSTTAGSEDRNAQSASRSEFRFSLERTSRFGSFTYVPEQWGELHLKLENAREVPRDLLCVTHFDDQPSLQFGRRVWLPPRSKLSISHPILVPKCDTSKVRNLDLHSLVIESSLRDEVLVKNESGQLLHDGTMLVADTLRHTGVIAESGTMGTVSKDVLDLLIADRVSQKLHNKVTVLSDDFLPADDVTLGYLDHLVIAENRLADDDAALSAVRRWLHAGGRLWIMLDRVDPTILERLFGDDFSGTVVDRVGLTSVRIDKPASLAVTEAIIGEMIEYDVPVQMTRMVVSDMKIRNTVNGWPAAMTKSYGEGRLLVTTLGPRGWIKPRSHEGENEPPQEPLLSSEFSPLAPMNDLAAYFLSKREADLLTPSTLEPLVGEYIGYTVPTRGLILTTLFGFLALLVATAIWLLRSERLERLGSLGSILAVLFSNFLILVGRSYRHAIPGTIASVQFAQAITGTDDIRTTGMISVYHPEGSQAQIETTRGAHLWPDMTGFEGSNRRMITTDLGETHWENLAQPAGLRTAPFSRSAAYVDRIEARATLDSNGIVGILKGTSLTGSDALVATRIGRIGVKMLGEGTFKASADDVFDNDQYLSASFLGDEQDRRRRTLEKLLNNRSRKSYPDRPQLMFWLDGWENGCHFGDDLKKQGTTLLTVPLVIDRPSNGTEMLIPKPLLGFHTRANPDGSPPSGIWNDTREEFQERSSPGLTWLNFQIPQELLPITARKARVHIEVSGPMGRIELMGLNQGTIVSLHTQIDPVGQLSFDVDDPEVLTVSDDGGLSLGISAGDPSRPELTKTVSGTLGQTGSATGGAAQNINANTKVNYWKIKSLALTLWAKTSEPTSKD